MALLGLEWMQHRNHAAQRTWVKQMATEQRAAI